MRNISNEFRRKLNNGAQPYVTAQIRFSNDDVVNLNKGDFADEPMRFTSSTSSPNNFEIGAVIISELTLKLNNYEHKWDNYDFVDACIEKVYVNMDLDDGTTESVPFGVFWVDETRFEGGIITVIALDNLAKLDNSNYTYRDNWADIMLSEIAYQNGLTIDVSKMKNKGSGIKKPDDLEYTARQLMSYILQATCNFAICDEYGTIHIRWYDFETLENLITAKTFESPSVDIIDAGVFVGMSEADVIDAGIVNSINDDTYISTVFDAKVDVDDVVITGVNVIDKNGKDHLSGAPYYVITIKDNPLVGNNENRISGEIAKIIVGKQFRPLNATILNNPTIQPGDMAYIRVRGVDYATAITNVEYAIGKHTVISCEAESPLRNSSKRLSQTSVEQQTAINNYNSNVQSLTTLMSQSFGIFKTEVKQEDGSTIYYMHNKPSLAESSTQWKMVSNALAISTDYGQTWQTGITSEGNVLVNVLSAVGVKADWIEAGTIEGEIIAKNLNMQGGKINISTDSVTEDYITLNHYDPIDRTNVLTSIRTGHVVLSYGNVVIDIDAYGGTSDNFVISSGGKVYFKAGPYTYAKRLEAEEIICVPDSFHHDGISLAKAIKTKIMHKDVTIPPGHSVVTMGALPSYEGMTFAGVSAITNGAGDNWQVSYTEYGGNIIANVYSYLSESYSSALTCSLLFVNNNYVER